MLMADEICGRKCWDDRGCKECQRRLVELCVLAQDEIIGEEMFKEEVRGGE